MVYQLICFHIEDDILLSILKRTRACLHLKKKVHYTAIQHAVQYSFFRLQVCQLQESQLSRMSARRRVSLQESWVDSVYLLIDPHDPHDQKLLQLQSQFKGLVFKSYDCV